MPSAWSGSACGSHRRRESSPRMMLQDPFRLDLHAASYASPLFDVDLPCSPAGCLILSLKKQRRKQHRPPLQLLISNGLMVPKVLRVLICPLSLLIYSLTFRKFANPRRHRDER